MDTKKITNFIFELGMLKMVRHRGLQLAGVEDPDTLAEHALRAAQIGYILAVMENNPNPERVACMLIIHDNGEIRIGDQTKVGARYFSAAEPEKNAFEEQLLGMGEMIEHRWKEYFHEQEERTTPEGIIAKDADWLEMAFEAKKYVDLGYASAQDWIDNVEKALETESAKKIIAEMKNTKFTDWWNGLKKMTYTKLAKN